MKPNVPSRSKGIFRRMLDIGDTKPEPNPLLDLSKTELMAEIAILQARNMALQMELTVQQNRANQALIILGGAYRFMFGIVFAYMTALKNFKEAGNDKPLPTMWLAARVCESFEDFFDKYDLTKLDIGPQADLLRNVFDIANRPLNPGSKIATYLGIPEPEATPTEEPDGAQENQN